MSAPLSPRSEYIDFVEGQIEEFKEGLTRDELLSLADEAVAGLFDTADGQYPLTEILLKDAVDALIFHRLHLPTYRQWLRSCQNDTDTRPQNRTDEAGTGERFAS